jgi:hypothetical protein
MTKQVTPNLLTIRNPNVFEARFSAMSSIVEEIPPYLRGVQCEACHGEGKGHPEKGKLERKVTLGACRNCHTKDQSPTFNYMAYLEKIGCKISQ